MISKKDLDLLTDEFDKDGDGEITYEEFIEKVMPPEITHGGGGIMEGESERFDSGGYETTFSSGGGGGSSSSSSGGEKSGGWWPFGSS